MSKLTGDNQRKSNKKQEFFLRGYCVLKGIGKNTDKFQVCRVGDCQKSAKSAKGTLLINIYHQKREEMPDSIEDAKKEILKMAADDKYCQRVISGSPITNGHRGRVVPIVFGTTELLYVTHKEACDEAGVEFDRDASKNADWDDMAHYFLYSTTRMVVGSRIKKSVMKARYLTFVERHGDIPFKMVGTLTKKVKCFVYRTENPQKTPNGYYDNVAMIEDIFKERTPRNFTDVDYGTVNELMQGYELPEAEEKSETEKKTADAPEPSEPLLEDFNVGDTEVEDVSPVSDEEPESISIGFKCICGDTKDLSLATDDEMESNHLICASCNRLYEYNPHTRQVIPQGFAKCTECDEVSTELFNTPLGKKVCPACAPKHIKRYKQMEEKAREEWQSVERHLSKRVVVGGSEKPDDKCEPSGSSI